MSVTIVYSLIIIMATAMTYALVWLTLTLDKHRLAEELPLKACLVRFRQDGKLNTDSRHHWLNRECELAGRDVIGLRESADRIRHATEWMHQQLLNVANTAMALGFVGTVDSMVQGAGAGAGGDLAEIIGYGMMTTFFGLMIAIPGTIFHGLTNKRVTRLLDQIEDVIEALDDHINPPEAMQAVETVKPPPGLDIQDKLDSLNSSRRVNGIRCTCGLQAIKGMMPMVGSNEGPPIATKPSKSKNRIVSPNHMLESDTERSTPTTAHAPQFESTEDV